MIRSCRLINRVPLSFSASFGHNMSSCSSQEAGKNLAVSHRSHTCGELDRQLIGHRVTLSGWVQSIRFSKFLLLRDFYGYIQVNLEQLDLTSKLATESVVKIDGIVLERPQKDFNKAIPTGEIEVLADKIELLNSVEGELPFTSKHQLTISELKRLTYRYLDLRSTRMHTSLKFRSELLLKMRNILCNSFDFLEIETPYLFKRTPGSPQQFKQLLMVGGIDRYMQVARCFRNEDSRADRQPEFTQLDLEMAFVSPLDVFNIIETLLHRVWSQTPKLSTPHPITPPFPRLKYHDAMSLYGTDKPDIRFGFQLHSTHEFVGFNVDQKYVKSLDTQVWRKYLTDLNLSSKNPILSVTIGSNLSNIEQKVATRLNSSPGDRIIYAIGGAMEQKALLGIARTQLAKELAKQDATIYKPGFHFLWVYDFPLFEINLNGSLASVHHPFTAPTQDTADLIYTDPLRVTGQHYDLVCNGVEVGGGSIRIHNGTLQHHVLANILGEDVGDMQYFIDALNSGAPPHGGIALGIDRLIALLLETDSIRDVIAFPKAADGKDLMCGSPAASIASPNCRTVQM